MTIHEDLLAIEVETLRECAREATGSKRLHYAEMADEAEAELRDLRAGPHPLLAIEAHADELEVDR